MIQSEKENNNMLLKKLRQFDRKVQTVSSVYYGSYFFLEHCNWLIDTVIVSRFRLLNGQIGPIYPKGC
jgi:hypothetical protein